MIPIDRLFIATIADDAQALAERYGVGLELDEFCTAANMDAESFPHWDAVARQKLAAAPQCILHAPFAELAPAAIDPIIRQAVRARFEQAYALARSYGIHRMVVHAGFIPHVYFPEWFVEQSALFWQDFLRDKPADFLLLIENVLEADPGLLEDLMARIGDRRARICLDIGHAHCQSKVPLPAWITRLAPYIGHVHLHNNDSTQDSHSAFAEGSIPIRSTVDALLKSCPDATFTLELRHAGPSLSTLLPAAEPVEKVDGASVQAPQAEPADDPVRGMLKRVFGYDDFRQGQRPLVDAQLGGRDALGIMPTGAGKSICFQLPALLMDGITLVISPLISLMKDQVSALNQSGVRAAYLNSSLTERQFDTALRKAAEGAYRLIYIAPERLLTMRFLAFAKSARIALVAVDEAHCISQWGQDFRPSYLDIPRFVSTLPTRPVVSAFTATATPQVRQDILRMLALDGPAVVQTGFDRPNLHYAVERPGKKDAALLRVLAHAPGQSGIVYCATRKNVEKVCDLLQANGIPATRYHAGLSDSERQRNQDDFTYDRAQVIVATNAFGMGIDKSNVRFIVHYNMPKDLESYYQEAGRAGRDGERAECVLLFSGQDESIQRHLINLEDETAPADPVLRRETRDKALRRLEEMVRYCRTHQCLRAHILTYFGEENPEPCGNCGNCAAQVPAQDLTEEANAILSLVAESGERFGLGSVLEALRGANTARVRQFGLDRLRGYGALSGMAPEKLKAIGDQLIAEDYLAVRRGNLPIVVLGARAAGVLREGKRVQLHLPTPEEEPAAVGKIRFAASIDRPAPADPALFEALRAVRLRLATELGVPAFVVFSDATLRDMCEKRPQTQQAMLQVKGVGESKMRQFGEVFLQELKAYMARG